MTLILKLDLDMVKMYLHTKNEVSMSRGSKVKAWTDRHTDRHDMTENITYPHTRVVTILNNGNLGNYGGWVGVCGDLRSNAQYFFSVFF